MTYVPGYTAMETAGRGKSGGFPGVYDSNWGVPEYSFSWSGGPGGGLRSNYYWAVASDFTMSGTVFSLTSPTVAETEAGFKADERAIEINSTLGSNYFYFVTSGTSISANSTFANIYRVRFGQNKAGYATCFYGNYYGSSAANICCLEFGENLGGLTFEKMSAVGSKGTANGTVSNSAASTYPPRGYCSKSARIWPYSAPGMRGSGRASTSMYPLLGAALTM